MKRRYVAYALLGFLALVGYNAFLIQRDSKLFEAYSQTHYE
jgi:hypothetical protein